MLTESTLTQLPRFLPIDTLEYRFPAEVKELGYSLTLLHHHSHAPSGYVLLFEAGFDKSIYKQKTEVEQMGYPCSWYLEDGEIVAYEFSQEKITFVPLEIEQQLR